MTDDSDARRGRGRLNPFLSGLPGPRAGRGGRSPDGRSGGRYAGGGPTGRGGAAPLVGGRTMSVSEISFARVYAVSLYQGLTCTSAVHAVLSIRDGLVEQRKLVL